MSPFKPTNGLFYQGPSSAIPSLEGNANDRSSALGRRPSQSSLLNIPNNNKRLSGAHQKNSKRLRRELPESTKADEPRVGLTDGQGIETDRNSLRGSAPREAWEDEFMQYPEDNLVPQEDSLVNRVNFESLEHLSGAPNQDSNFFNFFGELDFGNASASFENPDSGMGLASSSEETSNIPSDEFTLDASLYRLINLDPSINLLSYLDCSNLLKNQNSETNCEKKLEANHAAPSIFGAQNLEENAESKAKNKDRKSRVRWTDELRGIANTVINNNSNKNLKGIQLYGLFKEACQSNNLVLKIPSSVSFMENFLERVYKYPVRWTDELRGIAKTVIDSNSNKNLNGIQLYELFKNSCESHNSELKIPNYESFLIKFLGKIQFRVNWTDELKGIANTVMATYSNLGYRKQYKKFEEKCKEKGLLEIPKLAGFYNLKEKFKGQQKSQIEVE